MKYKVYSTYCNELNQYIGEADTLESAREIAALYMNNYTLQELESGVYGYAIITIVDGR